MLFMKELFLSFSYSESFVIFKFSITLGHGTVLLEPLLYSHSTYYSALQLTGA